MRVLQEAFTGIFAALATSLLVFGAIALAITEGMVVPEADQNPPTPTTETSDAGFPEFFTSTPRIGVRSATARPTARLVVVTTQPAGSTCPAVPGWERYITLPGDSLPALAAAHGVTAEQLMDANCLVSSILQPGWQIFLPRLADTATSQPLTPTVTLTSSPTNRPCGPPAGWVRYSVRSGDTLTRISMIYSVSISNLQRANCMGASIFLRTGDSIYVPNVTPRYTATHTPQPPPPTAVPPTAIPPTAKPPTAIPTTTVPPTAKPPTGIPTTAVPPTAAPPTAKPPTTVPTTAIPTTAVPTTTATSIPTVVPAPALTLTKTANPMTYDAVNQAITYTYVLRNTGNVALDAPFVVSDDKTTVTCPNNPVTLAQNAAITCTTIYTIKQVDLDAGSLTNQATATAKFGNLTITAKSVTRVTAVQTPSLLLTKSGTLPASPIQAGNIIHYSYMLKNNGNVTLNRPITVSDDKTRVSCLARPITLAPNASLTCIAAYTIVAADITAGSVTNTATAHAIFNGNPLVSNQATTTLNIKAGVQPDRTTTASSFALRNAPAPQAVPILGTRCTISGPISQRIFPTKYLIAIIL